MYQDTTQDMAPEALGTDAMEAWADGRSSERARRAAMARRVSGRRRKIDPTTTDREYSCEELEFMKAMQEYKRRSGRMFPTWSEVLEVLKALGYEKQAPAGDQGPPRLYPMG